MPGREKEYEAFKAAQAASGQAPGGPAYAPPPIDAERRSRSPGLQNNFYEVSTVDFKRPYGMPPAAPEAPPADAGDAGAGSTRDNAPLSYGTETPMPGREGEYEAFQAQGGAGAPDGPAYAPPPIDAERRSRSPGLQNNFYDKSTADFKRPHGVAPGAAPPAASVGESALPPAGYVSGGGHAPQPVGGTGIPAHAAAPASGMPEHVTRDASPAAPPVSDANGALLESICKTIDALAAVTAGDEEAARLHLEAIQRHAERSLRRRGGAGGGGGGGGGGGWGADGDAADRR